METHLARSSILNIQDAQEDGAERWGNCGLPDNGHKMQYFLDVAFLSDTSGLIEYERNVPDVCARHTPASWYG